MFIHSLKKDIDKLTARKNVVLSLEKQNATTATEGNITGYNQLFHRFPSEGHLCY